MTNSSQNQSQTPGFGKVVGSVLASFFGVQSGKTHEQDFTRGRPMHYILVGLAVTIVFVLSIWGVVQLVVGLAQ